MNGDFVDALVAQWESEVPELDLMPLGIFARLARYTRLTGRVIYANLAQFNLNETQLNMLAALRRSGDPYRLTPRALSTSMLLTSGAMTYVIDQMESAGNVERLSGGADRRSSQIQLTPVGKQLIEDAMASHLRVCAELVAPVGNQKCDELIKLLRDLLLAVDKAPPTGSPSAGKG